jgi:hypothetical protein
MTRNGHQSAESGVGHNACDRFAPLKGTTAPQDARNCSPVWLPDNLPVRGGTAGNNV